MGLGLHPASCYHGLCDAGCCRASASRRKRVLAFSWEALETKGKPAAQPMEVQLQPTPAKAPCLW